MVTHLDVSAAETRRAAEVVRGAIERPLRRAS